MSSWQSILNNVVDGATQVGVAKFQGTQVPMSTPEREVEPTNAGQMSGPQVKGGGEMILNKNHLMLGGLAVAAVVGLVMAVK